MGIIKKLFYTFISLISIYILAGFLLVPYILKKELVKNLDENLNAKSTIEKIEFNPLTFDLKVHNFKLISLENEELIKLKELQITLGILKSLEQNHFRVEYILLDELFVNLIQTENGNINLAQLLKQNVSVEEKPKNEEKPSNELAFLIAKLDLKNTNLNFTSYLQKEPFNLNLKDINYTIYDLGTYKNFLSSNNLNFQINKNTDVTIKGAFNINPFKAYGKVEIKDLRVKDFLEFDKSFFNFSINEDANINLALNYNIDNSNEFLLNLNSEVLEVNNLDLIQNKNKIVNLKKLDIKRFNFDLKEQNIDLNDINIDGLNINMIMDKSGVNFANLVNTNNTQEEIKSDIKDEKPWKINFKNINVNANYNFNNISLNSKTDIKSIILNTDDLKIVDSSIYLNNANLKTSNITYLDKQNNLDIKSTNTNLKLDNLSVINSEVKIGNIELAKDNLAFKEGNLNLDINSKKVESSLKNLEIKENISYELNNLKLKDMNFNDKINKLKIDTKNIELNTTGFLFDSKNNTIFKTINLKNPNLHFEDLNNKLSINTKDINLASKNLLISKDTNISLESLKLTKPTINLLDNQNNLKIDAKNFSLDLNNFKFNKGNIILGSIKLLEPELQILNTQSNLKIDAKNIDLALKKLISKENFFRIEKTDLLNPHISIVLPKNDSIHTNKIEENQVVKKEENKFRLNLGPVDIKNLTLDFEDKNLPIPFKTTISKLNGQVSEIKNKEESTSQLEIKGVVDEYGVAKITGVVNPNSLKILTDINMKFQNIAMKSFTPYTAKFVGRAIKDGKLELDLNYNISDSNLKAKNSIIIKKLELGEKVESADAISLPLDLAITLLEDSSNIIDINLPVSGNVDDPQFSVGSIIWKAFVNLITKAITSPFSLIGSLFNFSEDEIKSVNFDLKESEITPIQKETLDKIALILGKKEEIAIKFGPSFNEKEEKEKVAQQRAENIKEYLLKEKSINPKQIILEKDIKKSSPNINLNIEVIK
ncbi:DUF748 domain-containing membrane protein [Aliarcobacter faecis]|uniref:DUF748 domain-containing protein n=1 Tax=Aliarcobacter faecis TaxID=1564138 RepID=UPI00047D0414|nr:DUF748 domain-containing protein [Aliarcobacter faecis]QKF73327.1 DUF748 domain-containing membrane protein [Aliarcobacter faecis]